jgi:hypothetical protein
MDKIAKNRAREKLSGKKQLKYYKMHKLQQMSLLQ